jgi:hypothetical protein
MQNTRFNELLDGLIVCTAPGATIDRLSRALQFVVQSTGEAGEKALEEWCRQREEQDDHENRA